jgi:predicted nucleic acid-binding Zn ribbon protein
MPSYIYRCPKHHTLEISQTFAQAHSTPYLPCPKCQGQMHRVPQPFSVNWGGLPPHLADARPPAVQQMIDTAPERRARYLETKGKK